jgi:hypothetical protein
VICEEFVPTIEQMLGPGVDTNLQSCCVRALWAIQASVKGFRLDPDTLPKLHALWGRCMYILFELPSLMMSIDMPLTGFISRSHSDARATENLIRFAAQPNIHTLLDNEGEMSQVEEFHNPESMDSFP